MSDYWINWAQLATDETLYLIGGGALLILGNERSTFDIDYVGNDLPEPSDQLAMAIQKLADEMQIEVDPVPLDEFIPLPTDADQRHRLVGQFGRLTAYIFDPYSIAISKLDRGFESDLQDIVFLIRQGLVDFEQLTAYGHDVLERRRGFDLERDSFLAHLATVAAML